MALIALPIGLRFDGGMFPPFMTKLIGYNMPKQREPAHLALVDIGTYFESLLKEGYAMRLSLILTAAAVAAGAVGAADPVRICSPSEACIPVPVSLGDEPARNDGPRGPVGPA
jgi:hypothetical protein